MKRVAVIGLGSMGRRRVRLMQKLPFPVEIVGVDTSSDRRADAESEFGITVTASLDEAIRKMDLDAAFVCTAPLSHESIVTQCLTHGLHVFTEINLLGDWYGDAMRKANDRGVKLFLSSTFLYRKEIEYISSLVRDKKVNYIYHSGQYLPDWHPWESYKAFFVSNKRTNACREILAIEFPWIINAFGEIESLNVLKDKNSSLDLDFNDNYMMLIRHKNGSKGVFCQDVIARKGLRRLEVYSEKVHVFWDGTPQTLQVYNIDDKRLETISLYGSVEQRAEYNANIVENAYMAEIEEFFEVMDGTRTPRYSYEKDVGVLKLIDGIEAGLYG